MLDPKALKGAEKRLLSVIHVWLCTLFLELWAVNAVDSSAYGHWIPKLLDNDLNRSTSTMLCLVLIKVCELTNEALQMS